ncbi:TetR/AcrR family transcriptional regulator [Nocardioides fonticola]
MTIPEPEPDATVVKRRPGGRSAIVRTAVQEAAVGLLEEVGYERLLLTDVAARAGVNKTTVYRRWPTKQDLVAELLGDLVALGVSTPDTGTLVGDLEVLLGEVAGVLRTRAVVEIIRAAIGFDRADQGTSAARAAFWEDRYARSSIIVERAIGRGELPTDTDPRRYLEQIFGPLYLRTLVIGEDVDDVDLAALARRDASRRREADDD